LLVVEVGEEEKREEGEKGEGWIMMTTLRFNSESVF
jgi:hypothetical protein